MSLAGVWYEPGGDLREGESAQLGHHAVVIDDDVER